MCEQTWSVCNYKKGVETLFMSIPAFMRIQRDCAGHTNIFECLKLRLRVVSLLYYMLAQSDGYHSNVINIKISTVVERNKGRILAELLGLLYMEWIECL